MKKIIQYTGCLLLVGVAYLFFVPKQYNAPFFKPLDDVAYWKLSTGSTIGYKRLTAMGNKQLAPIIYLHGGPGGAICQHTVNMLQPFTDIGHTIYLYDQIGSGHSERLKNISEYTVERHKKDLEAIVKIIGAEKVILIGQSWGAILATLFVAENPKKVAKIICTGPGPILPINKYLATEKAPDSFNLKIPMVSNAEGNKKAYGLRSKLIRWWALVFGTKLATDEEVDLFFSYLNTKLRKSTVCDTTHLGNAVGGGGYYAHIMTVKSFNKVQDPRAALQKIQIPVLIMKGQCDNQKWGFTKEYLDYFQYAQLAIVPNAGHNIYTEQADVYVATIRRFLEEEKFYFIK